MDAAASSCLLCRFYDKAHKLDVLDFFKAKAVHPDAVPDAVFRCIGRTVWADIGEHLHPQEEDLLKKSTVMHLSDSMPLAQVKTSTVREVHLQEATDIRMLRNCDTL